MATPKTEPEYPLQFIKGVGPARAKAFAQEGIYEKQDLLYYLPRTYLDRDAMPSLQALSVKLNQDSIFRDADSSYSYQNEVLVVVKVASKQTKTYGRNKKMLIVNVSDSYGGIADLIYWNYIDYHDKHLIAGNYITVIGKPEQGRSGKITFHHPETETFDAEDTTQYQKGQIIPVYRLPQALQKKIKLNLRQLRAIIKIVLEQELASLKETLPDWLIEENGFPTVHQTIKNLHFPDSRQDLQQARNRIKFEEMFYFQLFLESRKQGLRNNEKAAAMNPKSPLARKLYDRLPFELTKDQKRVIREIAEDMESGKPMNRLLQGDVGSGKTIVSLLTMLIAVDSGYQVVLIAPTEILAEQHYHSVTNYLEGLDIRTVLLTGSIRKSLRNELLQEMKSCEADIIIGTHSLFQKEIEYGNLGYIVVDEQHRFGVEQRAELRKLAEQSLSGANLVPHILVMSATPIPRTLSMTVYGDLDQSVIRQLPGGRKPIKTKVVFESQKEQVFSFIKKELSQGRQAYIVYPLVEKSEKMEELKAATEHFEELQNGVFSDYRCGLLHGQMKWLEKEEAMRDFLNRAYDILLSTTVIEVGIDVPNATVMLIENSERFGLSQLHQLRGRVGRSSMQSYCLLSTRDHFKFDFTKKGKDEERATATRRLLTMERTTDGFEIAQADLELRGPGDLLGTSQSGLPNFKYINIIEDTEVIRQAKKAAEEIITADRNLKAEKNKILRQEYIKKFSGDDIYFDIA